MSRCLITGCRLVIPAEGKSIWGDLFECSGGEIFVFSGNVQGAANRAVWAYEYPLEGDSEVQIILDTDDYTERRGIVTMDAKGAHFNEAAKSYLCDD